MTNRLCDRAIESVGIVDNISLGLGCKEYKLYLANSKNYFGMGVFAGEDIPKNAIIFLKSKQKDEGYLLGRVNDANFVYPKSYEMNDLYETFKQYKEQIKDKCNLGTFNSYYGEIYKTNRFIKKDEELTKYYGIPGWSIQIALDIVGKGWLSIYNPTMIDNISKDKQMEYLLGLQKALAQVDYTFTITRN